MSNSIGRRMLRNVKRAAGQLPSQRKTPMTTDGGIEVPPGTDAPESVNKKQQGPKMRTMIHIGIDEAETIRVAIEGPINRPIFNMLMETGKQDLLGQIVHAEKMQKLKEQQEAIQVAPAGWLPPTMQL